MNSSLDSLRRVCKLKIEMFLKLREKFTEKSSLVGLIDYFRILKALIILFLLFVCMNFVSDQNRKVLDKTLAGFNSDDVKTVLRRLRYFKMTLPLLHVLQKFISIPLSLCHTK